MRHEQRRVEVADGARLHVDLWAPAEPPRFIVVVLHGAGEHVRRYSHIAMRLVEMGGLVFGPDHRGQGRSDGRRGHIDSFDQYVEDLDRVMQVVGQEWFPPGPHNPPWFLFAHSMGGLVGLDWLQRHERDRPVRGAVISAPLLALAMKVNPLKAWVGRIAGDFLPTLALPSGIPSDAVSRDPEVVARYDADRERTRVVTAAWFRSLNERMATVRARIATMTTPMLWIVGTGDRICDHRAMLEAFASLKEPTRNDQTLEVFEGYYHEAHNEPEALRRPVIERQTQWIERRVESASPPES